MIVLNDDHNTFDGVAFALARVAPGRELRPGLWRSPNKIHNTGQAIVWAGREEPAELYWEQLQDAGLTMAPLEQDEGRGGAHRRPRRRFPRVRAR